MAVVQELFSKPVMIVVVMALGIFATSGAGQEIDDPNKVKKYGPSLKLPSSVPSSAPIIIEEKDGEILCARVSSREGKGRVIQLLRGHGSDWAIVDGCENVTSAQLGQNMLFLLDARRGPDGKLWVFASTSANLLFCRLDADQAWQILSDQADLEFFAFGEKRLRFLGGMPAASIELVRDEPWSFFRLDNNAWQLLPVSKILQEEDGTVLWYEDRAWLVFDSGEDRQRTLHVAGIGEDGDLKEEPLSIGIPNIARIRQMGVSESGNLAVWGVDEKDQPIGYVIQRDGKELSSRPMPSIADVNQLVWSPDGRLYVVEQPVFEKVELRVLNGNQWDHVRTFQDSAGLEMEEIRLYFLGDEEPRMVWESWSYH